jgi:predicted transcriptional regulator
MNKSHKATRPASKEAALRIIRSVVNLKSQGLTQQQIGNRLEISQSYVSKILRLFNSIGADKAAEQLVYKSEKHRNKVSQLPQTEKERGDRIIKDVYLAFIYRDKGWSWQRVGDRLGYSRPTIKKYCDLMDEGGEKAIRETIANWFELQKEKAEKDRDRAQTGKTADLIRAAWKNDFKYNDLWNTALNIRF